MSSSTMDPSVAAVKMGNKNSNLGNNTTSGSGMNNPASTSSGGNTSNGMLQSSELDLVQPIRNLLLESLSTESQNKVKDIVKDVEKLSKFERLLLYLELPSSQIVSDPLRQPINPLGSRSEIQLTITWIRTHLEEDPQVSLPKHEVYDEYTEYCNENGLKALSTADFGKVMKQVYPQVRPRRLGTRGNSRYCYAGLKKKVKLEEPCTPDCIIDNTDKLLTARDRGVEEAAMHLILEWAEKLFKERMNSVKDLAVFLIDKMYVDNRSAAVHTLLSSVQDPDGTNQSKTERKAANPYYDDHENGKRKKMAVPQLEVDLKRKKFDPVTQQSMDVDKVEFAPSQPVDDESKPHLPEQPEGNGGQEKRDLEEEMRSYFSEGVDSVDDMAAKSDQLSQLRQLLVKSFKSGGNANNSNSAFRPATEGSYGAAFQSPPGEVNVVPGNGTGGNVTVTGNGSIIGSAAGTSTSTSLCQRRRVSFNPLVVHDTVGSGSLSTGNSGSGMTGNGAPNVNHVQPSPGTRKRHFSFQPISPRQNSLPQSPNASPFISPRSTPVPPSMSGPLMRSRHSSGSALLPLHLLPQGNKNNSFTSSSSDTSRAATFGSTSECSTPFISPHGTPIPFNRSRHNSAQGRLCRSRHSSGLGGPPYRYNMPFSPMALNNLNNPYSPQPSTPIINPDDGNNHMGGLGIVIPPCDQTGSMGTEFQPQQSQQQQQPQVQQSLQQTQQQAPSSLLSQHLGHGPLGSLPHDFQARSRHSSAESEPAMRTFIINADDGSKGGMAFGQSGGSSAAGLENVSLSASDLLDARRQRHASAGQASTLLSRDLSWDSEKLLGDMKPSTAAIDTLKDDERAFDTHQLMDSSTFHEQDGAHDQVQDDGDGQVSVRKDVATIQDDLDITLSALKDCDNDFSKFVLETESGK